MGYKSESVYYGFLTSVLMYVVIPAVAPIFYSFSIFSFPLTLYYSFLMLVLILLLLF